MALKKRDDRGSIIRSRRTILNLTLRYIAQTLEISENHLSGIERGEREVSAKVLLNISRLLRMTADERDELFLAYGKLPLDVQEFIDKNPKKMIHLTRKIISMRTSKSDTPPIDEQQLAEENAENIQ